jgi:NadR type nicotinamide-nucleotide adenylyltransferase
MTTPVAVVLMTALIPTLGHKSLIEFAGDFVGPNGKVLVIVSSRSHEPVAGYDRVAAIQESLGETYGRYHVFHHADDNAPQNPETQEEWDYWKNVCLEGFQEIEFDHWDDEVPLEITRPVLTCLVASEPYGKKMADVLGVDFIPFDIDRRINSVKGTKVRENLIANFDQILPWMQYKLAKRITIFGQESCGKTTMTNRLDLHGVGIGIHEFARPYLESLDDKTITDEKMENIVKGQFALQKAAFGKSLYTIQDTDLLSTLGYYRIYGGDYSKTFLLPYIEMTKAHLYIVMNDEIPFEEDALRYGGKVRESTKQFWIDILEEFNCEYYVVKSANSTDQLNEIWNVIEDYDNKWFNDIRNFKRD